MVIIGDNAKNKSAVIDLNQRLSILPREGWIASNGIKFLKTDDMNQTHDVILGPIIEYLKLESIYQDFKQIQLREVTEVWKETNANDKENYFRMKFALSTNLMYLDKYFIGIPNEPSIMHILSLINGVDLTGI